MVCRLVANLTAGGLFLLLTLTPFLYVPGIEDSFRLPKEIFFQVTALLLIAFWGIGKIEKGPFFSIEEKRKKPKGKYFSISFFGAGALFLLYSLLLSLKAPLAASHFKYWINILAAALLLLFLRETFKEKETKRRLVGGFILSAVAMSLYSIAQYFGRDPLFHPTQTYMKEFLITSGFLDNPNIFGAYLASVFPLALLALLEGRSWKEKVFWGACLLLLAEGLLLTKARTGVISLGASLFIFYLFWRKDRWKNRMITAFMGVVVVALLFVVANNLYFSKARKELTLPDNTFKARMVHWVASWIMIKEEAGNLILGKGLGAFKVDYLEYRQKALLLYPVKVRHEIAGHVHNEYLQVWVELGLIGLVILGIMIIAFFLEAGRSILVLDLPPPFRGEKVAAMAVVVGLLVNSLASFPFHIVPTVLSAIVALALGTASKEISSAK